MKCITFWVYNVLFALGLWCSQKLRNSQINKHEHIRPGEHNSWDVWWLILFTERFSIRSHYLHDNSRVWPMRRVHCHNLTNEKSLLLQYDQWEALVNTLVQCSCNSYWNVWGGEGGWYLISLAVTVLSWHLILVMRLIVGKDSSKYAHCMFNCSEIERQ